MSELLNKYQIEQKFHNWIEGFSENSRFENSIDWNNSFCVQTLNNKKKKIDDKQVIFK